MSKKQMTVIAGMCTLLGAATAASRKRKWEDVHQVAAIVGAFITLVGALS